jgi:hypothetical protein
MDSEELRVLKRIEDLLRKHMPGAPSRQKVAGADKDDNASFKAVAASSRDLDDGILALNQAFKGLTKEVRISRATFYSLNKAMRANASMVNQTPTNQQPKQNNSSSLLARLTSPFRNFGNNLNTASSSVVGLSKSSSVLRAVFDQMRGPLQEVVNDIFMLQSKGIGAGSLTQLYADAIKAGMSLDEYSATLDNAETALTRSGGLEKFGEQIRRSTGQLSQLGIFGPAATKMAAQMAESATSLGVPQAQLSSATDGLTQQFSVLRKTSAITADVFAELVKGVQENQDAQRELLGLAPGERLSRMQAQVQIATFGKTLGLTAQLTKAFGDELLSQRSSKYSERFEGAGRVRQIAAFTGMDATEAERLARYAKMKNTSKLSKDEIADYQNLAAKLEGGIQQKMNSGNDATVAIAELYKDTIASLPINKMMEVSGKVQLAKDSGNVNTPDFGKNVGMFGQAVGEFATIINGMGKNPLANLAAGIAGVFAGILGAKAIGGVGGAISGIVGTISAIPGKIAPAFAYVKSAMQMVIEPFRSMGKAVETLGDVGRTIAPSIVKAVSGAFSLFGTLIKGASIAGLIVDPIMEMFTGTISNAFSPDAGFLSRMGDVVFAGFRGLFTGVTGLIDTVFGTTITNTFDKVLVMIRAVSLRMLRGIVDTFTSILPDSMVPDFMKSMSKNLTAGIDNADAVLSKLADDSNQTLATIGKANSEIAKGQVDDAKKNKDQLAKIQQQTNNVVFGTGSLATTAKETASSIAQSMPTPSPVRSVTQPTVNTTDQAQVVQNQQAKTSNSLSSPEVVNLLAQLVALLQRSVVSEELQTQYLEALSKLGVRSPNLGNNEDMIAKVYRG